MVLYSATVYHPRWVPCLRGVSVVAASDGLGSKDGGCFFAVREGKQSDSCPGVYLHRRASCCDIRAAQTLIWSFGSVLDLSCRAGAFIARHGIRCPAVSSSHSFSAGRQPALLERRLCPPQTARQWPVSSRCLHPKAALTELGKRAPALVHPQPGLHCSAGLGSLHLCLLNRPTRSPLRQSHPTARAKVKPQAKHQQSCAIMTAPRLELLDQLREGSGLRIGGPGLAPRIVT